MKKSEVYSWRVSTDLKAGLEREARRRKMSLSAVLDVAAREWLIKSAADINSADQQLQLHNAVSKYLGILASGNAQRSENTRATVRQRLGRARGS